MLKNVQFLKPDASVEIELLIVLDKKYRDQLDKTLNGAISYNLKRGEYPVWMTTNGMFSIPKIVIADHGNDLAEIATTNVAIACGSLEADKLAFNLLSKRSDMETLFLLCEDPEESSRRFEKQYVPLLCALSRAKELISAPSNLMTPSDFAKRCQELERQGVDVEVLDEIALKKMGAHALLAVGKGSVHPPRMVVMHYKGADAAPIALVGKGVCFDAGGIHLKSSYLNEMKWDKAGAGVVFGVLDAISGMKLPLNVVGVVCLAENMPDGGSLKPGDVISTLAGKTVEIVDTDCEGRLVLADGLTYVQKHFAPKMVIDLGTLALETFGALGGKYAGLFCNETPLSQSLKEAGERIGECLWPLPLGEYYAAQIRSKIADLKNAGIERYGASSAAAEFLRAFINPKTPWAHIDISGVSWNLHNPNQGVSGFGVRLLVEYLEANFATS